ncbi:unnamed protein product [Caenorhabditis angaria]|uniref:Inner centromere protein ARK-binding domain-containing protein n=1 Tax=Caenorhabditis angaria TaxID=860376 RepID=A0A9P1MWZ3_9PELO|nr:unnamed protein product [Caenorhabditis angaria]
MPPKRATSRRVDNPTSAQFFAKQIISERSGLSSSIHTKQTGDIFSELVRDINSFVNENLEEIDISENFDIIPDDVQAQIVCMISINTESTSKESEKKPKRSSLKPVVNMKHVDEPMDSDIPTSSRSEMVTDTDSLPTERSTTPPITSETTEEEMETDIIPRTVTRLQNLSVKRTVGRPRNVFSSKPAIQTPIASISTPAKKDLRNVKPLVFEQSANKTPRAQKPTAPVARVAQDDKIKHAIDLRDKFLKTKVAKAKVYDEKSRAVKERKMELDRKRQEQLEEKRRKEQLTSDFQRNTEQLLKSPSRLLPTKSSSRLQALVKSPSRNLPNCSTPRAKTTQSSQDMTPGRRPAKFGKVETFNEVNAHATVPLSPSRQRARSGHKSRPVEEEAKPEVIAKNDARAKKQEENERQLRVKQEAYLLKQQELKVQKEKEEREENERRLAEQLEKKRIEEEKAAEQARIAEKQKREEMKQKEALKNAKKAAEAERLAKLQKEEAERLRIEEEKEEKAYEATIAKQAASSNLAKNSYEMTPPRVYVSNSKDDYGLNDLNSDDETDQEDEPRKDVPQWADWAVVRRNARELASNMPFDVNEFFGEIQPIKLKTIFGDKVKMKKRGSSAVWKSPMTNSKSATPKLCGIKE